MQTSTAIVALADEDAEELPQHLETMTGMSDDRFATIGEEIQRCCHDTDALDDLLAEVFWDRALAAQRMPAVVQGLLDLAIATAKLPGAAGTDNHQKVTAPGVNAVRALFRLGVGRGFDEVRVRWAPSGAPCVLIMGGAGDTIEDLEPQAKCYEALGLTVVYFNPCPYPTKLRQRQFARFGQALRKSLGGGGKLLLHACSGHGAALLDNLFVYWGKGQAPFDALPPPRECVRGAIFECIPVFPPTADSGRKQEELQSSSEEGDGVFIMAANHVLEKMCADFAPGVKWYSQQPILQPFLRRCNTALEVYSYGDYGASSPVWCQEYAAWWSFDDAAQPRVPRMFLCGEEDRLYTLDSVEASVDAMWNHDRTAKLQMQRIKAAHMQLWKADPRTCTSAVRDFVRATRVRKPWS